MTGIEGREILGRRVCESFRMDERGSLADMVIESPEGIQQSYKDSILSKTDSGWYELDIVLPNLDGGRRLLITVAPIQDDQGMVRGAIQTLQQPKSV
jgi:hypothetical protein